MGFFSKFFNPPLVHASDEIESPARSNSLVLAIPRILTLPSSSVWDLKVEVRLNIFSISPSYSALAVFACNSASGSTAIGFLSVKPLISSGQKDLVKATITDHEVKIFLTVETFINGGLLGSLENSCGVTKYPFSAKYIAIVTARVFFCFDEPAIYSSSSSTGRPPSSGFAALPAMFAGTLTSSCPVTDSNPNCSLASFTVIIPPFTNEV